MLFAWIDKHGRLRDEQSLIANGDRLSRFNLNLLIGGRGLLGLARSGVFPASMHEDSGQYSCFWGEVYNFPELQGITDSDVYDESMSPARVLASLVERYGAEGLARVNGQFAFMQWDALKGRLVAATDRFRILPLVYYEDGDRLIVAADARIALACPNVDTRLDPQAVYDFVAMSIIPSPETVYRRIRKLPARQVLEYEGGRFSVRPYTRLEFPEDITASRAEAAESVREEIFRAVDRRRLADSQADAVGAFLSGGLDSSTVVGMLTRRGDRPVKAFSIGFGEPRFDELEYARLAARHFGAEHHVYVVTASDTLAALDEILDQYDEPFGNSSAVPVYWCARLARQAGMTVLYGGDGGDEIFAGNPHYLANRHFEIYHSIPRWLRRRAIEPFVLGCPFGDRIGLIRKGRSYIRRAHTPNPERLAGYEFLEATAPTTVFRPDFLSMIDPGHPMQVRRDRYNEAGPCSELNHILCQDLALVVSDNDLRKVTEMSARAGVRVVYPMLDPLVVGLAGRIPASWNIHRFKLRALYKEAMKGFLPDEIISKEKKGFGLPVGVWLKQEGPLGHRLCEAFAGADSLRIFREGYLKDLLRLMREDAPNYYGAIAWVVMMLLEWLYRQVGHGSGLDWGEAR